MNAMVPIPINNADVYRASTDAADMCRAIVTQTAMTIQNRKYVKVEGWQAIAVAHGCIASSREVKRVDGGVSAIGEVRRMSDGALVAQAEGFVGEDEPTWYGGTVRAWKWGQQRGEKVWFEKELEKRPDYAIRAMAQTRAISRACRSAFAHVVVMIDANLSTTPAEEIPHEGFYDAGQVMATEERSFDPPAQPPQHVEPRKPTLAERTEKFRETLKVIKGRADLERAYKLASKLLADLDAMEPETLSEINALYEGCLAQADTEAGQ